MKNFLKIIYAIFYIVIVLVATFSILSVFRNEETRLLKFPDFPRIQFFVISFISLIVLMLTVKKWKWYDYLLPAGLLLGLFINGYFLINYTMLVPVDVPAAVEVKATDSQFSILLTNVKMSNRESQPLIKLIQRKQPDLILAMETDSWWNKELKVLKNEYQYAQETINEAAYGMVLYSKYPLVDIQVKYLNNKKVPSFDCDMTLSNGKHITLHCVHPVPPTHFEDLPDNEGQEEKELKKLGREVAKRKYPTIVAGDLNDVVWSYVDELTGTEDILYDVRVGRGFYNSYNAEIFLMRWPLDHVFVTEEFRLKKIERLEKIGSDHFPIYVELVL
ncbi:endonuclease/exonuclease/phosphatase family protein [Aquimarina sp. M1]